MSSRRSASLKAWAERIPPVSVEGAVLSVSPLGVEISDRLGLLEMGSRVEVETASGTIACEVTALREGSAFALAFSPFARVRRGAAVRFSSAAASISPADDWLGRVIDGLGRPIDDKGPLSKGPIPRHLRGAPPSAPQRARLGSAVDFGVKALDLFAPCCIGQRMGVFAASGVGKSALLGMIARNTACDISIIALIGERGREVREFIEDHLGEEGLSRSVVIVATSDEPAMMRREAGFLAMALAEHFRDEGAHVLCLMDSLTRIATAQREIGLAAGEPPATKGFTPSVFSLLPSIVERAGPGRDGETPGYITGVFSVLVEGDDHDEPVADTARAVLDGHIVLEREIAERGRFPAVNILRSVSRAADKALTENEARLVQQARRAAAVYEDMRELIRIGAYRSGSDAEVDQAVNDVERIEDLLRQPVNVAVGRADAMKALKVIIEEGRGSEQ